MKLNVPALFILVAVTCRAVDTTSAVPDEIMICWALDNGAAGACQSLGFNGETTVAFGQALWPTLAI